MKDVVIVSACRTAIGAFGGTLKDMIGARIAAVAMKEAVKRAGPKVVLVAHSLACLAVAHWVAGPHSPVKAALLVAVPNSKRSTFPKEAVGFADTPTVPFSFRSTVVVSDDDPFGSAENAERLAAAWGSRVVRIGPHGHINADSGLGDWPEGYALLKPLLDL